MTNGPDHDLPWRWMFTNGFHPCHCQRRMTFHHHHHHKNPAPTTTTTTMMMIIIMATMSKNQNIKYPSNASFGMSRVPRRPLVPVPKADQILVLIRGHNHSSFHRNHSICYVGTWDATIPKPTVWSTVRITTATTMMTMKMRTTMNTRMISSARRPIDRLIEHCMLISSIVFCRGTIVSRGSDLDRLSYRSPWCRRECRCLK